jgi:hypothetical protein
VSARRVPGYSHRDEPISALAAQGMPSAAVMVPGFLGLAAGTFMLGRSLHGTRAPSSVAWGLQAAGIATAVAGLGRCSDRSCPTRGMNASADDVTISDDVHAISSGVVFGLWTLLPLVAAAGGTEMELRDRLLAAAFGAGATATAFWNFSLFKRNSPKWGGVSQRATLAFAFGFYPAVAIAATRP